MGGPGGSSQFLLLDERPDADGEEPWTSTHRDCTRELNIASPEAHTHTRWPINLLYMEMIALSIDVQEKRKQRTGGVWLCFQGLATCLP